MAGHVANADLQPFAVAQHVVIVAAHLVGRPHIGGDFEVGNFREFAGPGQHHHLDLLGDGKFGAKAQVLTAQLRVQR
ncbi:hypothetical protein D9M68_649660 [compost metagenome]